MKPVTPNMTSAKVKSPIEWLHNQTSLRQSDHVKKVLQLNVSNARPTKGPFPISTPDGGSRRIITPDGVSRRIITPGVGSRRSIAPDGGSRRIITPNRGSRRIITPDGASRRTITPDGGSRRIITPDGGSRWNKPQWRSPSIQPVLLDPISGVKLKVIDQIYFNE